MIEYTGLNALDDGWVIAETEFDARFLGKFETIFVRVTDILG